MDHIAGSYQNESTDKGNYPPFTLPLVTVILVNYNYGRYLKQATDSIFEQTYPNIECIIVDNASTDESDGVLLDISKQYPGATIVRRSDNAGQTRALQEGFELSSGEYLVFLDADDVLLPAFVETHIFVHLSLRIPVGFTSADAIQTVESRLVLGTYLNLNEYVLSGRGKRPGLLRRIDECAPGFWPLQGIDTAIEGQVHYVEPGNISGWHWAPTSANCFRRDALRLFLLDKEIAKLRGSTDGYLLRVMSLVTGSVLIDRPLSVYRLHATNAFARHPHLNCLASYERGGPTDRNALVCKMINDYLIANAKLFLSKMHSAEQYINTLAAMESAWPPLPSTVAGCHTYLAGRVVSEWRLLARELGIADYAILLKRLKITKRVFWRTYLRCKFANGKPNRS